METSLRSFVNSLLECLMERQPTQTQVDALIGITRRADFERLTKGDFVISLNSPKLKEVFDSTTPFGSLLLNPTEQNIKIIEQALKSCKPQVDKVNVQNNILRIHLNRTQIMKTFIPTIIKEQVKYGNSTILGKVCVAVRHHKALSTSSSLTCLRGEKITEHLRNVLEFCGATVRREEEEHARRVRGKEEEDEIKELDLQPQTSLPVTTKEEERVPRREEEDARRPSGNEDKITENKDSKSQTNFPVNTNEERLASREEAEDTRRVGGKAEEEKVKEHKDSKPKTNFSVVTKEKEEGMISGETIENKHDISFQTMTSRENEGIGLTGKDEAAREHDQYKPEITREDSEVQEELEKGRNDEFETRLASEVEFVVTDSLKGIVDGPRVFRYYQVVDAKTGNVWNGSVQDYCGILTEELRRASEMKLDASDSPDWREFIETQAQRCLTLQLLSHPHSNKLRVEIEGETTNTKEVSFMLYNYARLCNILEKFDSCVKEGSMPPLPPADDVDYSLLNSNDEWDLMWLYLLRWPEIIEETATGLLEGHRHPKTTQIFQFLLSLSHRWSKYYCRHQVLCKEFASHLLPHMYAKLHLLQALNNVMRVCFSLLGIRSLPSHM